MRELIVDNFAGGDTNDLPLFMSICSGIETASVAWNGLMRPMLFSEIEAFPRAVLAARHGAGREVPLWGDFTTLRVRHLRRLGLPFPQVLIGGTPCQAFSIAGARRGLADARGNLALAYVRLAHALAATGHLRFAVWENVVGVLSMPDNAFGCFLGGLSGADDALRSPLERGRWPNAGMVAGPRARIAWRVLDAQHFKLAQHRERVFVVAGFGDGADPAAVLFERKGSGRHSASGGEARQNVAGTLSARTSAGGGLGTDFDLGGGLQIAHTLRAEGFDASEDGTGRGTPLIPCAYGRNNTSGPIAAAAALNARGGCGRMDFESETFIAYHTTGNDGAYATGDQVGALNTGTDPAAQIISGPIGVRRLTPRDCERLMGFQDDYTAITYRGKPAADGPRYKALGNSMATPVIRWIGERIVRELAAKQATVKARTEAGLFGEVACQS